MVNLLSLRANDPFAKVTHAPQTDHSAASRRTVPRKSPLAASMAPVVPWYESGELTTNRTRGYKAEFEAASVDALDWIRQPGMTKEIPAARFGGMIEVYRHPDFEAVVGYLTDHFLKKVGVQPPEGAKAAPMHTYRYYPMGNSGTENHKGGGRDHLLHGASGPSRYGVKGSGINEVYSGINGEFKIDNFRRNGLLELPETLVEQGVGMRVAALGGPIVPHLQLSLLPEQIQKGIQDSADKSSGVHWTKNVAVQVIRDLRVPRESTERASPEAAARMIGFQSFFNIGHGAMAPANQAGGNFLDLGHMSFNPPGASGLYRCAVCVGDEGTTAKTPDWFLSSLGHYYPGDDDNSYTFKINKQQGGAIVSQMVKLIAPDAEPTQINKKELEALKKAWKEDLPFAEGIEYQSHILKFGEEIIGAKMSPHFKPHKLSVGLRMIMQVAGLKQTLSPAQAAQAKETLLAISADPKAVATLYDMFDRAMSKAQPSAAALKPLFNQEIPTNVLLERLDRRLEKVDHLNMEGVQEAAKTFLGEETMPVQVSPQTFFDTMTAVFGAAR